MRGLRYLVLRTSGFFIAFFDFLCLTLVLGIAAPPLLAKFMPLKEGETYGVWEIVKRRLDPIQQPLVGFVRARLPHTYDGADISPFIVAAGLFALCFAWTKLLRQIRITALEMEELERLGESDEASRNVHERLDDLSKADASDRDKVLELYAKTKKILDSQRREVTFLAVDVINSTGMKNGEDPILAERDFRRYREVVETSIARHDVLKAAWTPDGVMMCFGTLPQAVTAAQDLIIALGRFNREGKTIKADFHVRCGVNSGEVLYDEAVRMEEMADGSIDLAGHMQKYAEADTIYAAKLLVDARGAGLGFQLTDKKVDGFDVCVWRA